MPTQRNPAFCIRGNSSCHPLACISGNPAISKTRNWWRDLDSLANSKASVPYETMPEKISSLDCKRSLSAYCGCCFLNCRGSCCSGSWKRFRIYVEKLNLQKIAFLCVLFLSAFVIEELISQDQRNSKNERYDSQYNIPSTDQRYEERSGMILEGSIKKIVDGDTVILTLDNMPSVFRDISCRLRGIDTPELRRSRCCVEKCLAKVAKEYVAKLHPLGSTVRIISPQKGKYFRIIANLTSNGKNTADILLLAGLAVRYEGYGERFNWCSIPKNKRITDSIEKHCHICK